MELNIFNGDFAYEAWQKSGGTSQALVWRENYLEGCIPPKDTSLTEFELIRAKELNRLMPELSVEKIFSYLQYMDRTIAGVSPGDTVFLWFDACMYDQIMLSRILFLLKDTTAAVFLICDDIIWGASPELFADKKPEALRLGPVDIALYASAWEAVTGGAEAVRQLLAERKVEPFPLLAKAMARYQDEFPGPDGLGRSERQLLEIIRSGKHSGLEIFRAFDDYEEYMFMGDTMCWHLLDGLAEKGFITIQSDRSEKTYHPR